ncbi:MAG: BrnA antitoxin family protein [Rickettsiales bacterium]|jgi:uncharacterized protein (DUF4415 family)|nr:BrnA antitoxin family protein [Rickettsiales bacterium]
MSRNWTTKDGEIKEVTPQIMKHMRLMRDVDPAWLARFEAEKKKRGRGRPQGRTKAVVSLSIDKDILQALRKSGAGWQSRVNALLRAAVGLK